MANYCVMNMGKRHRSDVRGLQAEANREYDDEKKYKNKVDLSKSHNNVYFVKSTDWHKSIDEVLEANGIQESRNSVVLITSVYSVSPEWFTTHTEQEAMDYFKTCFEYEQRTKGEVINCVVHKDETTWHMQVATVPVTLVQDVKCTPKKVLDEAGNPVLDDNGHPVLAKYKKGKSEGKVIYERKPVYDAQGNPVFHTGLNAKQIFGNRVAMSKRQTDFYECCGKKFGMERGEIRIEDDETAKERLTEAEFKAKKILEDAEKRDEESRKKAEEVEKRLKELDDAKKALEELQRIVQSEKDALDTEKIAFEEEKEKITFEYKNWQANANMALKKANEEMLNKFKKEIAPVISGYTTAKERYESAAVTAEVVGKGFSIDTINAYDNQVKQAVKRECEKERYNTGKTLWDIAGRRIMTALSSALLVASGMTSVDAKKSSKQKAEEARRIIEKTPKTVMGRRFYDFEDTDDFSL